MNRAEILSPCGGPDSLEAAVNCGCDAIYVGSENFSARKGAKNFSNEELREAVSYCHKNGVKVYQAINTLVFDNELGKLAFELENACKAGVDAVIVQDLAVVAIVSELCPQMPVHASTQMSIHTEGGMLICKRLNISRVVAARELSFEKLSELCGAGLEVEAFVHGALCMSVSGQCYMSAVIGSRSANRGLCAQCCRLPFSAVEGRRERYDLSLKDLSAVDCIDKLQKAGVSSLKIEGRMKRPEYVAAATDACRSAQAGEEYDRELLRSAFSRGGFTDGYLLSQTGASMFGTRSREDVLASKEAESGLRQLYRKPFKRFSLEMSLTVREGERVKLEARSGDGFYACVFSDAPEKAKSREIDRAYAEKQLCKLGQTAYYLSDFKAQLQGGLAVSAAALNELRRKAVEELDGQRLKSFKSKKVSESFQLSGSPARKKRRAGLRLSLSNEQQLYGLDTDGIQLITLPLEQAERIRGVLPHKLSAELPRYDTDERKTAGRIEALRLRGLQNITVTNIGQLEVYRDSGLVMHGGFGLNIANSVAAGQAVKLGAADITASFELSAGQLEHLNCQAPVGIIAYGRLPVMLTVNCSVRHGTGCCSECTGGIYDRTGRRFPVRCSNSRSYAEVLNSEVLWLADKLGDFDTLDFLTLCFYEEDADRIAEVIESYKNGDPPKGRITRGLYYRGLARKKDVR